MSDTNLNTPMETLNLTNIMDGLINLQFFSKNTSATDYPDDSDNETVFSRMAEGGSDEEDLQVGIDGLVGIILSALLVSLILLVVASVVVSKSKNDENDEEKRHCCTPVVKRLSDLKKRQCCVRTKSVTSAFISRIPIFRKEFWIRKNPADAVRLVETNSSEPSIREWQQTINLKLQTSELKSEPSAYPADENFYEIDLSDPLPEEPKPDKMKEEDNNLMAKYLSLLSDKYHTVKKKLDESGKSDESKSTEAKSKPKSKSTETESTSIVLPLTIENENFNPVSDDFEAGDESKGEIIEGNGRCRALNTFEPNDDCYRDMPGLLKVSPGEELIIIQKDLGSGWTSVRNVENQIGFVPTNILYSFE